MKSAVGLTLRAAIMLVTSSLIGIGLNLASSKPLPWMYEPSRQVEMAGVNVPLIDEKEARKLFGQSGTVFVDSRNEEDYFKGHVTGAVFLTPHDNLEERFIAAEPFLPQESHLILYCYGPQCDMAEEVARFLAQLGYRKMTIMSAGYRAWEKAGYPVEKRNRGEGE